MSKSLGQRHLIIHILENNLIPILNANVRATLSAGLPFKYLSSNPLILQILSPFVIRSICYIRQCFFQNNDQWNIK